MTTAIAKPHANVVAEQLIGRDYLSFSAISTYTTCPLKFFFRYVEGLPEETVSSALVFGAGIHAAAELWFNELITGNPAPDHDTLLAAFWNSWQGRNDELPIRYNKNEDINSIGQLADRVLNAFRQSEFANPNGTIIAIEEELRGELIPGVPDFLGRIDLIVEIGRAHV